jgi:L-gulonate 3-dehydrogenase
MRIMSGVGRQPVAIIGCGLIGRSWAIAFARAGHQVRLFDPMPGVAAAAAGLIMPALEGLHRLNLLHGSSIADMHSRFVPVSTMAEALSGATHVQENAPEDVALKQTLFAELDALADPAATIASSTSALMPSQFAAGLPGARRCLTAHPLNPPHLVPAVEIVPGPETDAKAIAHVKALMEGIGQQTIVMTREVEGFVMNRLQGAILDEAMKLVAEGYVKPEEIDTAMKHGLALRWSFMGPFETIDLNAPDGVADFLKRYKRAYDAVGASRPDRAPWDGPIADVLIKARRARLPMSKHPARQQWRDARLAALAGHKLRMNTETGE